MKGKGTTMKRIWTGLEYRELHKATRNQHGDIMLTLDGGEVWQFTPRDITVKTPRVEKVDHVSILRDSKTGAETPLAIMILNPPKRKISGNLRKLPREQEETIERAVSKAAAETFKPLMHKAVDAITPPAKRDWWVNVQAQYAQQPGPHESDKWLAVAHVVILAAIEQNKKTVKDRDYHYGTPVMLKTLIAKVNAQGASLTKIEAIYSEYLRKRVTALIRKHKKA